MKINKYSNIFPNYNRRSLINVPHTILSHFGITPLKPTLPSYMTSELKSASTIVLFMIDGFGWSLFKKVSQKNIFFKRMIQNRKAFSLKSVFPSSTTPALTSFYSGLTPIEHGLFEWVLYFRELDATIKPLPYETVGKENIKLLKTPSVLFEKKTVFQLLAESNVRSVSFLPQEYKNTMYTKSLLNGSYVLPYVSFTDLNRKIKERLILGREKYISVYIPFVDTVSHVFGPTSTQAMHETEKIGKAIENLLGSLDYLIAKKSAFILTADHGQKTVNPSSIIYLNNYPEIIKNLKIAPSGHFIPPTGGPRDIFLSVKEERIRETISMLKKILGNKAVVIKVTDKVKKKIFGSIGSSDKILNRIGNVIILPTKDNIIWYRFDKEKKFSFLGHHGGLDTESMRIPLIISKAINLL